MAGIRREEYEVSGTGYWKQKEYESSMISSDVKQFPVVGFIIILIVLSVPVMADTQTVEGDHTTLIYQTNAVSDNNQQIQTDSAGVTAWISAGDEQLIASRYQEALDSFNKALVACNQALIFGSVKSQALTGKGNAFIGLGRPKEALNVFSQAYDLDPLNTAALVGEGDAYTGIGQYQEAVLAYNRVLELNQSNPSVQVKKGNALGLQERPQAAINAYKLAIKLQPGNADAWGGEGFLLASLNRHQEALEAYNQSLKYNPQNADTWINAGKSLWVLGLYQESLDSYNHALALRPNDVAALEGRETVTGLISRYHKAIDQTS